MRFDFHPDLVEQAVFAAARGDAPRECELHESIDRLYQIPDQELRQRAFQRAYGDLFGRWSLSHAVADAVGEFALVESRVDKCVAVPAARGKHQSIELFVKAARPDDPQTVRTLLLQVAPDTLLRPDRLRAWLPCELMLVSDMLDDDFGYAPDAFVGTSWERELQRDRYHVLWRIHVLGRLIRAGRAEPDDLKPLRAAFSRAFAYHGLEPSDADFEGVLKTPRLTHAQLVIWAGQPELVISEATGHPAAQAGPRRPGDLCPLCGFPTYDWYGFDVGGGPRIAAVIERARPEWRCETGACRQCVETYASVLDRSFINEACSIERSRGKDDDSQTKRGSAQVA